MAYRRILKTTKECVGQQGGSLEGLFIFKNLFDKI